MTYPGVTDEQLREMYACCDRVSAMVAQFRSDVQKRHRPWWRRLLDAVGLA